MPASPRASRPVSVLVLLLAAAGCTRTDDAAPAPGGPAAGSGAAAPAVPAPPSAGAGADDAALAAANDAADRLGQRLRARLLGAMSEGGPATAIRVCADEAQALTAEVGGETGARVGRSSLRPRSEANAPPDWVAAWLAAQGERSAAGVTGIEAVADGHARVLRPIAIEPPCLTCHGDPAALAPEVASLLGERYPADRATGYALGDLRGALWAEVDVVPAAGPR